MFINIIWFIAFVVLTVLAARFFMKTIRSSRMPIRFGGRFFVGFLTLLLGLISILGILGMLAIYNAARERGGGSTGRGNGGAGGTRSRTGQFLVSRLPFHR
jgi:hypothetical protein